MGQLQKTNYFHFQSSCFISQQKTELNKHTEGRHLAGSGKEP